MDKNATYYMGNCFHKPWLILIMEPAITNDENDSVGPVQKKAKIEAAPKHVGESTQKDSRDNEEKLVAEDTEGSDITAEHCSCSDSGSSYIGGEGDEGDEQRAEIDCSCSESGEYMCRTHRSKLDSFLRRDNGVPGIYYDGTSVDTTPERQNRQEKVEAIQRLSDC